MISVERCAVGRLRDAYPVGEHDLEVRVENEPLESLGETLRIEAARLLSDDSDCRKVVFAAPEGDLPVIAAAELAGFRYVVDVDVCDSNELVSLSLLVYEPERVTFVDMDLDQVPQT